MDAHILELVVSAYLETAEEAMDSGHDRDTAHLEGVNAASLFLSAMTALDEMAARRKVENLGLADALAAA